MGRLKGSKNKPKLAAVDGVGVGKTKAKSAPAAPSTGLTDADNRVLLNQHCTALESLITKKDAVVSDIRNERNRAKASGFTNADVDYALKLRASKSTTDDVKDYRRMAYIALLLNHPIGTEPQMDLNRTMDDANRLITLAEASGYQAGLEGLACSSPYSPGSPQDQAWIRKWHDAQAVRAQTVGRGAAGGAGPAQSFADELRDQNNAVDKNLRSDLPPTAGMEAVKQPAQALQ